MLCPYCGSENTRVLESRLSSDKTCIRRRRECENCSERFTTYERFESSPVMIIKKDKSKEEFSREKLMKSIQNCFPKEKINNLIIEEITTKIELEITLTGKKEISSSYIGEKALQNISHFNQMAYVRYLTVFKEFETINNLVEELKNEQKKAALFGGY